MHSIARVILKSRRARPFWFGHPWVFSGAIDRVKGSPKDGGTVALHDADGRCIGYGFYNDRSQIRVRAVSFEVEGPPSDALFARRLAAAVHLREEVLRLKDRTNAYRVVHAEGDGIPGFVVDRLGDLLIFQVSCLGLLAHLEPLIDGLEAHYRPRAIIERSSSVAREEEGLERADSVVRGTVEDLPVEVVEDGTFFSVRPLTGQKTGFYGDQRDNRRMVSTLVQGMDVLDAFSYVGGFGLRLARAGAKSVHLLDSSESAIDGARLGAARNGVAERVTFEKGNVLRVLEHMAREGREFDLVVVDPPKLVHRRKDLERGLRLYHEVNAKAVRVLRPGGILTTCSCSQHVTEQLFEEMLGAVAKDSGVRFQEIYRGGQGPDHPILLPLDESRYLTCRILRVLPGVGTPEPRRFGVPGPPTEAPGGRDLEIE